MKISYNWLKDLIDTNRTPQEISDLLTGCGLEVESLSEYNSVPGGLEGIVVGHVKSRIKHPNADKLSITTVDIGNGEIKQIVCGAPNVAEGQKVLVATVGSTVHPTKGEPFKINKSKIRGEVSEGMICAEDELGLGESHEGILVLPAEYETGKDASHYFPVCTDHVFEIGLTANRGDAASHLGVARDLKALTGSALTHPGTAPANGTQPPRIQVVIEDKEGCPRYSGLSIDGIAVKESPVWLKDRLKAVGLSPINNIVDATNYVMLELGQPLHAFDEDKISGKKIIVKTLAQGTKFTTLDKVERTLRGTECMICDDKGPVAIAGVFGGLDSGITERTTRLFIESACFNPASVRHTAKLHTLNTDASFRYERGTDPEMTLTALQRVAGLIIEIAGGNIATQVTDVYPAPVTRTEVSFSLARLTRLIGQPIPEEEVLRILAALDIETISRKDDLLLLSVPQYRTDVKREADVTEEVLRIYGLNKINIPTRVKSSLVTSLSDKGHAVKNKIADYLTATGFSELINNSLTRSSYYNETELKEAVRMQNPLSADLDIMRMNMLYGALECIQYNRNRKAPDLKFYEFGFTYRNLRDSFDEQSHFMLAACGMKEQESWTAPQKPFSYFTLKSVVAGALKSLGIVDIHHQYETEHPLLDNCTVILSGENRLGYFGNVKGEITDRFDIDTPVWYADLDWKKVMETTSQLSLKSVPVSPFPHVRRDLALLLDKAVKYEQLEAIARKTEPTLIRSMQAFDVYQGDKIEQGKKSYAISFILQDEQKTLTDKEIDAVMNKLIARYEKELGAKLRG